MDAPSANAYFSVRVDRATVALFLAHAPLPLDALSTAESALAPGNPLALRDWLTGRAALRAAMGGADTARIRMPNSEVSLSHSRGIAAAARSRLTAGLGVDIERHRDVSQQAARFFIRADEPAWLSRDLLRGWCVKEAIFKADLANAGRSLRDYVLLGGDEHTGIASTPDGRKVHYAIMNLAEAVVAVAACMGEQHG